RRPWRLDRERLFHGRSAGLAERVRRLRRVEGRARYDDDWACARSRARRHPRERGPPRLDRYRDARERRRARPYRSIEELSATAAWLDGRRSRTRHAVAAFG